MLSTYRFESHDRWIKARVQRQTPGDKWWPGGLIFYLFSLVLYPFSTSPASRVIVQPETLPLSVALPSSSHSGWVRHVTVPVTLGPKSQGRGWVLNSSSCFASWETLSRPPRLCIEFVIWKAPSRTVIRKPRMGQTSGLLQAHFKIRCNQMPFGERLHSNFSSSFSVV